MYEVVFTNNTIKTVNEEELRKIDLSTIVTYRNITGLYMELGLDLNF